MTIKYSVLVDDNFHLYDEDERYEHAQFDTYEAALSAAKKMVDESLAHLYRPGMTADELYSYYTGFGEDPFIKPHPKDRGEILCLDVCQGAMRGSLCQIVLAQFRMTIQLLPWFGDPHGKESKGKARPY